MLDQHEIEYEREFTNMVMRLYSNGIMHYAIKSEVIVEIKDVQEVLEFVEKLGVERKYLNLYEFGKNAEPNEETRKWASNRDGNKQTIADAIVLKSLAQKMIGNFYLKFHKPVMPTRIFTTVPEAVKWLKTFNA